jgi:hypothetical protein
VNERRWWVVRRCSRTEKSLQASLAEDLTTDERRNIRGEEKEEEKRNRGGDGVGGEEALVVSLF